MTPVRIILIVIVSFGAAFAVAAIAWVASKGHLLLFPLILIFGFPLVPLIWRKRNPD